MPLYSTPPLPIVGLGHSRRRGDSPRHRRHRVKRRVLQVVLYKRFTFCSEVLTFGQHPSHPPTLGHARHLYQI
jgi:hypothetical protein